MAPIAVGGTGVRVSAGTVSVGMAGPVPQIVIPLPVFAWQAKVERYLERIGRY